MVASQIRPPEVEELPTPYEFSRLTLPSLCGRLHGVSDRLAPQLLELKAAGDLRTHGPVFWSAHSQRPIPMNTCNIIDDRAGRKAKLQSCYSLQRSASSQTHSNPTIDKNT